MTEMSMEMRQLVVSLDKGKQALDLVKGVDLELPKGEITGIVGESGSGKSLTMKSLMGILPKGLTARYDGFVFEGREVTDPRSLPLAMIFQDPMTSLNPLRTIGFHLEEVVRRYQPQLQKAEREAQILAILTKVGIHEPALRLKQYPFEFSGGMRQRIMIAMALLAKPKILIADEPTTALDVTIQAQILALIKDIQASMDLTVVIVSHDFGVIAGLCDRVMVMRQGQVVEQGRVEEVFAQPAHPYTQSLLAAARLQAHSVPVDLEEGEAALTALSETHLVRRSIRHD